MHSGRLHIPTHLVEPLVDAVRVTFADAFGFAMLGGAIMCVVCSAMVWTFPHHGRAPSQASDSVARDATAA